MTKSGLEVEENTDKDHQKNDPGLLNHFSLSRALDGIFWSLLIFYVILITSFRDIVFSTFPFLVCLPLFAIAVLSYRVPIRFLDDEGWQKTVNSLRFFSLVAAFNFPFVIFIVRGDASNYFAVCCVIAVYGTMRVLSSVGIMSQYLGSFLDEKTLIKEGRVAVVLLYFSAIAALVYIYFISARPDIFNSLVNHPTIGLLIKVCVLIVVVFPLLLPVTLLFRLKTLIVFKTKNKMRKK